MTVTPALVRAEIVTGPGQVSSGASATGGGVGALGVSLHPAQHISASSVSKAFPRRVRVNGIVVARGRSMQAENLRECWESTGRCFPASLAV